MYSHIRSLSIAIACLVACVAHATIYYVSSATGNDANNGTSQSTPWKTIDKVNQAGFTYVPGDQILFQRGGTYRGQIIMAVSGNATSPIKMGSYGTGALPIVYGSKLVTGWTVYSGNIWKTTVTQKVDQVYVNDVRQTLARYPNTGWLHNTQGSNYTLMSTSLTQANGYWNGGRCVLRSTSSSVDTLFVSSYANSTLTFTALPSNHSLGTEDWGFYMCNKLNQLDVAGEWYYDKSTQQLYFWAPNNADPNTISVAAAVYSAGVYNGWNLHYQSVENISFRHQTLSGIDNEGADHVTVTGCTFENSFHAIYAGGSYNTYTNNTIRNIFGSGVMMIDSHSTFTGNTLTSIATVLGEGETFWGYAGVRILGTDNICSGNRLDSIGYTGIEANNNALVEKNVIRHANASLNDGGGIALDHSDGMIIQDNLILDPIGGLEGSSTAVQNYQHLGVGIYFGNTSIKNTIVQRNTVSGCLTTGIHVDHNMTTVGIQVKDNVLFNNKVGITISDYSNPNGVGAVAPYYVANFNDVYSGNVVYALNKDQLCLRFYMCHGVPYVDFGTFTNNRYFNPYNEMSIFVYDLATTQRYFTLERWKTVQNDEVGSTRSPLRQASWTTTAELSSNLVPSGAFTSNVTGWGGWPTNAQVTRVTDHLDNGCLKAYLPDNTVYGSLSNRNPEWYSITNGQWYRLKLSLQSNAEGDLVAGLKALSQANNPYTVAEQQIPFGPERRELEIYFQSTLTDQAQLMLVNQYTEPLYYLDNVEIKKVSIAAIDPLTLHTLLVNDQATAQNLSLPAGCWSDISGTVTNGSVAVPPYSAKVFYKVADNQCSTQTGGNTLSAKVLLGGALNWTTGLMRDDLRVAGVIPSAEPYTAMGYTLENSGATTSASVLAGTGNSAMVDWVLLELKNNDQSYSLAARRAAIVRKDGSVVGTDGSPVITFTSTTTVGKYLVIHHRNHLGSMMATPIAANGQTVDFTSPAIANYGTNGQQTDGTRKALWPGNANSDIYIKYTGTVNDRDPILSLIGGTIPTSTLAGYYREDVTMDGVVKYTGTNNDRDPILTVVGGTIPTNIRTLQVP